MWLVHFWVTLLMTLWARVGFRDASCKLEQDVTPNRPGDSSRQ